MIYNASIWSWCLFSRWVRQVFLRVPRVLSKDQTLTEPQQPVQHRLCLLVLWDAAPRPGKPPQGTDSFHTDTCANTGSYLLLFTFPRSFNRISPSSLWKHSYIGHVIMQNWQEDYLKTPLSVWISCLATLEVKGHYWFTPASLPLTRVVWFCWSVSCCLLILCNIHSHMWSGV